MLADELKNLISLACLLSALAANAAPDTSPPHLYTATSSTFVRKLGSDLYAVLDRKYQKQVSPDAIHLESLAAPVITPIPGTDRDKASSQVFVSAGYLDLLNYIAHAKAIDRIHPGYFEDYVLTLAKDSGDNAPPPPPNLIDRYWRDDVMNDQISYFNQMAGMTMAMAMSEEYLGSFNKYSGQMLQGRLLPINNFITQSEWEACVRAATFNSLNCALATDGAKTLFEAIDQMPKRPAWTAFIVPQGVDLKKVNKDLVIYEESYFHGKIK